MLLIFSLLFRREFVDIGFAWLRHNDARSCLDLNFPEGHAKRSVFTTKSNGHRRTMLSFWGEHLSCILISRKNYTYATPGS
jgi:hypothetical protein